MLSRPSQRYYGPLRLPGQPGGDFGVCLIPVGWTPVVHWPGSPVVPPGTILACHPCYPGGPRVTWQRWWSPGHRSSPSGNGVDALTEVHEATPGFAARYGLRGCARPSDALVRELGVSGYPSHLPQATRARCPLPEPDFHRRVPEYPRHATGHLRTRNCLKSLVPVFDCSRSSAGCTLSKFTDSASRSVAACGTDGATGTGTATVLSTPAYFRAWPLHRPAFLHAKADGATGIFDRDSGSANSGDTITHRALRRRGRR